MRIGLIAEKIGMTQFFGDDGVQVPITVLKIEPCCVVSLKTTEKDGYEAVQIGANEDNGKHINKPQLGFFKKNGIKFFRILKEFRVTSVGDYKIGDVFTVDHFKDGQFVDITGRSIGKGFAGAMKRHGFGGLRATHGVSVTHRSHGSIGNRTLPGRVFKNKRMAGHMGDKQVTALNLKIHSVDLGKNVIFIHGCVPGSKSGTVFIRDAVKKSFR